MAPDPSGLLAVGLSHHTAPVHVRERLALDEDAVRAELSYLRDRHLTREALLLSTCNRVELYAVPEQGRLDDLRDYMGSRRAVGEPLDRYLYWHRGPDAVRHLFRVAGSLDSLVIGEPQILGQVKDAVRIADDLGSLGAVLNRLTQRTFWVAKQIRTHTRVGVGQVGVGNAGVHLAKQIFSDLSGRRALLIGAGEMGREVAKAMVGQGVEELLVANRTFERAVEVAQDFGGTALGFDRVDDYLHRVDIVITATGAQHAILSASRVAAAMKKRRRQPLFLVDLSVPRNIDPAVDEVDNAFLFNIDDLTQVIASGKAQRAEASAAAEQLVERETARFAKRLADLHVNEAVGDLVRRVEGWRHDEIERSHRLLAELTPEQREALEAMTRAFAKKVLHGPLRSIRERARAGDEDAVATILAGWDIELPDEPSGD